MSNSEHVETMLSRGVITSDDIQLLRRQVFLKGIVTDADAELAFRLNDRLHHNADPAWPRFFVDALTDYVVTQAQPAGYVSDDNAAWLIQRIARSGRVDTDCELELLIKVLERSQKSPVNLVAFALEQVKAGVIRGDGAVGQRTRNIGTVEDHETELVRRILFAFGGDGNIAVTRAEAAVLFDIDEATDHERNHASWSDLFVRAIANFLMASSGYQVPSRQEALRRETWLDTQGVDIGSFIGRMAAGSVDAMRRAYGLPAAPDDNPSLDARSPQKPQAAAEDALWAAGRIGRGNRLTENEVALINHLKSLDAHLHPRLRPVLDRVAA